MQRLFLIALFGAPWLSFVAPARAQTVPHLVVESRPLPDLPELANPLDAYATNDGGVLLADYGTNTIVRIDSSGKIVRRIGRTGDGPGEFRALYRVTETRTGSILAFDQGTKEISWFTSEGRFVRRTRLPYYFAQVDRILAATDDSIYVIGVSTLQTFRGRLNGIHLFSGSLEHMRSFGPLAPVKNEGTRRLWGTGSASLEPDGALTYVLRQPYVLLRYSSGGRLTDSIKVDVQLGAGPDEMVTITPSGRGAQYHINRDVDVTRVTGGYALGSGRFLTGRSARASRTIDLLDTRNGLIAEARLASFLHTCPAFDASRMTLWCFGELREEPRLFIVKVLVE